MGKVVIFAEHIFNERKRKVALEAQERAIQARFTLSGTETYKTKNISFLASELSLLNTLTDELRQGRSEFRKMILMFENMTDEIERLNGWRLLKAMSYGLGSMRNGISLRKHIIRGLLNV